ncbi:MAG: apolipoprotein N-acyltransferase [Burkholderiaceae bacterium]|jgi:apolipoprotein N-acyltransferase|nr:apolipoprotein N-acyltransferase [Burkholderiaceae bacterium]
MREPGSAARAGLACAAGLAQAASLALPGSGAPLWWLQILSLAALAGLLRSTAQPLRGAFLAGLFATAWLCGTFWWLFTSLHTYGGLPAPLAVLSVLGLALFLASYYAVAGALCVRLAPHSRLGVALLFAGLWLLAELARNTLWTGFPWGAGGYAHVDGPLAALARWVGVYGMGFVAALLAMGVASLRAADLRRTSAWLLLVTLAGGLAAASGLRECALGGCNGAAIARHAPLSLALLQGNIPQDEKFQAGSGVPTALAWYARQLDSASASLVVAPETALPLLPAQLPPGYLQAIARRYAQGEQAALVGIPLGDMQAGYTNSVLGFAPGQTAPYRYDKHHLVPFGEFIPPLFRWFTEMMNIPLGDFARGPLGQAAFLWRGERIAPNICYEDLFGDEIAAHFLVPERAPTLLLNLSNIGWFGTSLAIDQHLAISRMRALEFERPMVRATNTGATAVIDYRGQVTHVLARATRGVLLAQVEGRGGPVTPFAWWAARWRLAPLWGLGTLCVLGAVLARRRAHRQGRKPLYNRV